MRPIAGAFLGLVVAIAMIFTLTCEQAKADHQRRPILGALKGAGKLLTAPVRAVREARAARQHRLEHHQEATATEHHGFRLFRSCRRGVSCASLFEYIDMPIAMASRSRYYMTPFEQELNRNYLISPTSRPVFDARLNDGCRLGVPRLVV